MARILIETYGCTLNQADSEMMGSLLERAGHAVGYGSPMARKDFDYLIVNTCTVKAPTAQRILDRLAVQRKLGRRLVVAGCMASANGDAVARVVPEASLVGTSNIAKMADAIAEMQKGKQVYYTAYARSDKLESACPGRRDGSVIAKIPIGEGCLSGCAFCESRFARGPLNSFSERLILKAIEASVANGAREMNLTAQDAGAYGLDRKTNIAELVAEASEIPGNFRIRVGMLNPEHLHRYIDALIEALQREKVYKFLHLPIQSGSDRVLKDMGRRYTVDEYDGYVSELRNKVHRISIETDIMVGYPTETDSDFEESVEWLKRMRPMMVNVSRFGPRPHAKASLLPQLPSGEIKMRSARMARVMREVLCEERRKLVGTVSDILITERSRESLIGRNESYVSVALPGGAYGVGEFVSARMLGNTAFCLIAEAIA
jgi:MiaB-like tRNA modifying enzyme